ncbi:MULTISPECIES: hypothetical protein [Anoxybacillaceae]|jgi:hypothetical protein|uniref:Uncharacterized protein n=1 Tax=Parageobacillus thermantarcticus TaxID=186116 RepID=A0A1I0TS49_9BACL|nr:MULTISPECIES: hypothetical protein [Bacillaceae]MED3905808.1 hypothetical protein [Geobacillus thermodenitrificans]SFA54579.1 hypothetical protein SAMN05192569_10534 [Parageobacillus thermantarcticus]
MSYIISSMFLNMPVLVIGATAASVVVLSELERWGVNIEWGFVKAGFLIGAGFSLVKLLGKMALFL